MITHVIDQPPLTGLVWMLVHGRPLVYWDDGFRGWRAVAQSTVFSDGVVVPPPLLDNDLILFEGIEDLSIETDRSVG